MSTQSTNQSSGCVTLHSLADITLSGGGMIVSARFCQTPSKKKGVSPPQKNYCRSALFEQGLASSGDDDGGHFVLVFEVEDLGAPPPAQTLQLWGECSRDVKNPSARSFSGERSFA